MADLSPHLIDDYTALVARHGAGGLAATAMRTRSVAARHLLARQLGPTPLGQLLEVARAGPPYPAGVPLSGPSELAHLARVVALQGVYPSDPADGLALFELGLDRFGPAQFAPARQALHAQLACALGHPARVEELLASYPRIPRAVRAQIQMELGNPFLTRSASPAAAGYDALTWERGLATFFTAPGPRVAPTGPAGPDLPSVPGWPDERLVPFDRITAPAVAAVESPVLITVVVTTFRAGVGLANTLESLLAQSWQQLEVLIVDDASGPAYEPLLRWCERRDPRVRVFRLARNGGTYRARNVGLEHARGSIVTFQDSDDWSHPHRLARQAQPLLDDTAAVATVSDGLRVSEELSMVLPGHPTLGPNRSSMMFRLLRVRERLGYFDQVRKAADTEYLRRIEAAFGSDAVRHVGPEAYALIRLAPGSLSRGDFGAGGWMHPGRSAYREQYARWHDAIRAGRADGYLSLDAAARPFPAPAYIRGDAEPGRYDVVFVADWRWAGAVQRSAVQELRTLARNGYRVALVQAESFRRLDRRRQSLCASVQELLDDGSITQVLLEEPAHAALVVVRYPAVLQFPPRTRCQLRTEQVLIVAGQAPSDRDGTGHRYVPDDCVATVQDWFGVQPEWVAHTPPARRRLEALGVAVTGPEIPVVVDPTWWHLPRVRDGACPVVGTGPLPPGPAARSRSTASDSGRDRGDGEGWRGHLALAHLPMDGDADVRLWAAADVVREHHGGPPPPQWLVYEPEEMTERTYLYQLDFWTYFPHPMTVEPHGFPVVQALAAGLVVLLPHRYAELFGRAALYCTEAEVPSLIKTYQADPERYRWQVREAARVIAQRHTGEAYLARMSRWLPEVKTPGTVPVLEGE